MMRAREQRTSIASYLLLVYNYVCTDDSREHSAWCNMAVERRSGTGERTVCSSRLLCSFPVCVRAAHPDSSDMKIKVQEQHGLASQHAHSIRTASD